MRRSFLACSSAAVVTLAFNTFPLVHHRRSLSRFLTTSVFSVTPTVLTRSSSSLASAAFIGIRKLSPPRRCAVCSSIPNHLPLSYVLMAPSDIMIRRRRSPRLVEQKLHSSTSSNNNNNNNNNQDSHIDDDDGNNQDVNPSLLADNDPLPRASRKRKIKENAKSTTDDDGVTLTKKVANEPTSLTKKARGRSKKEKTTADASQRKESKDTSTTNNDKPTKEERHHCLARKRELQIRTTHQVAVMGIDEAGRGPLAGPVVAAAIVLPTNVEGVVDSKAIVVEAMREGVYQRIVQAVEKEDTNESTATTTAIPSARWAVAVVDAATIDEINILQATMKAMAMAAHAVMGVDDDASTTFAESATAQQQGCYVVKSRSCGGDVEVASAFQEGGNDNSDSTTAPNDLFYALVDGNRYPSNLACKAEAIIKGDAKEFCIAAASILAKVTRDRLMNEYHELYPQYNFVQHKGYPTKAHRQVLTQYGPCPIHRRTFAPLKQQLLLQRQQQGETDALKGTEHE